MSRLEVTEKIITAKVTRGLKWADVAAKVGLSKEWVTAACLGVIDFKMDLQRELHAAGDRVNIQMSGKFLAYKTY